MLSVKSVAAVLHKTDLDNLTIGQIRGLGRSLASVGIKTKKVAGITYVDVREGTTCEGIIRKLRRERATKKLLKKVIKKDEMVKDETVAADLMQQIPLFPQPVQPTQADDPMNDLSDEWVVEKLVKLIEKMQSLLKERDDYIANLEGTCRCLTVQLTSLRDKLLTETVKKALIQYGED
jgi:hypothetical protein